MSVTDIIGLISSLITIVAGAITAHKYFTTKPGKQEILGRIAGTLIVLFGTFLGALVVSHLTNSHPTYPPPQISPTPTVMTTPSPTSMPVVATPSPTSIPVVATPSPTVIHIASNTILYSANWSNGLNGWTAPTTRTMEWHTSGTMLISDGTACCGMYYSTGVLTDDDIILAPYSPPVANYAVEAKIQLLPQHGNSFALGVVARYDSSTGVFGGVVQNAGPSDALITDITEQQPYTPDASWHTYRLEVKDNKFTLKIDNVTLVQGISNSALNTGHVGLLGLSGQLDVSSFDVIAL